MKIFSDMKGTKKFTSQVLFLKILFSYSNERKGKQDATNSHANISITVMQHNLGSNQNGGDQEKIKRKF